MGVLQCNSGACQRPTIYVCSHVKRNTDGHSIFANFSNMKSILYININDVPVFWSPLVWTANFGWHETYSFTQLVLCDASVYLYSNRVKLIGKIIVNTFTIEKALQGRTIKRVQ